jgi:hypothetical protein
MLWVMPDEPSSRRVFLSHTSVLRRFPAGAFIRRVGSGSGDQSWGAVTDMAYFPTRKQKLAYLGRDAVAVADMDVLIADSGTDRRCVIGRRCHTPSRSTRRACGSRDWCVWRDAEHQAGIAAWATSTKVILSWQLSLQVRRPPPRRAAVKVVIHLGRDGLHTPSGG